MIYFIEADIVGLIKIGYAEDVEYRFYSIRMMSPVKLKIISTMEGNRDTEKGLHSYFDHLRVRGEWFKPDAELLSFVKNPYPIDCDKPRVANTCNGIRRDGSKCFHPVVTEDKFCRWHQNQVNGIPDDYVLYRLNSERTKCEMVSKDETKCKAFVIHGTSLCAGHTRQIKLAQSLVN